MLALTLLRAGAHASVPFSLPVAPPASVGEDSPMFYTRPLVDGQRTCVGGKVKKWRGPTETVTSPIYDATTGQRAIIGHLAQMSEPAAVEAVEAAAAAWDRGQGEWPQMTLGERIATIEAVVAKLKESRDRIVNVLMWEICKNSDDAAAEFDRTVVFIEKTIATLRAMDEETAGWRLVSGIMAFVRRAAIGVMLLLGPFNYPFNETYAALIPALLMGNCVVMKIPAVGGLAHVLTMGAWASLLPKGVLNFVSGSGRATVPPMMRTGLVDVLGFIGGSRASDAIIREHPQPHRLKTFLQLDAKNVGVVCADADLDVAVAQCVLGATSYNGQRCTAIKLILVHEDVADAFAAALGKVVMPLPCPPPRGVTPPLHPLTPSSPRSARRSPRCRAGCRGRTASKSLRCPSARSPRTSRSSSATRSQRARASSAATGRHRHPTPTPAPRRKRARRQSMRRATAHRRRGPSAAAAVAVLVAAARSRGL